MILGKWHLGHHRPHDPISHGFQEWLGLPFSADMGCASDYAHVPDVCELPPLMHVFHYCLSQARIRPSVCLDQDRPLIPWPP